MLKNIWIRRILIVVIGVSIWHLPVPWELSQQSWQLFAIFFSAIIAIIISAFSVLSASLVALVVTVLTGTLTVETALSGFSESFMLLILAAFLVSKAVVRSGLGHRIALILIRKFGRSTLRLAYCITATDLLIGPSIPSNTARSGILFPIIEAPSIDTDSRPDDASRSNTGC